jgi:hypothetical protein
MAFLHEKSAIDFLIDLSFDFPLERLEQEMTHGSEEPVLSVFNSFIH